MSGIVSYELLTTRFGSGSNGFTPEGGIYETFINNTGISVKGTIVIASTTVNNAVDIAPMHSQMPIGIVYENYVDNGDPVKIVVYGKAEVLLKNGESSTNGYWCGMSDTAGRMYQLSEVPDLVEYNREIGHSLESKNIGSDVLSLVQIHFN